MAEQNKPVQVYEGDGRSHQCFRLQCENVKPDYEVDASRNFFDVNMEGLDEESRQKLRTLEYRVRTTTHDPERVSLLIQAGDILYTVEDKFVKGVRFENREGFVSLTVMKQ